MLLETELKALLFHFRNFMTKHNQRLHVCVCKSLAVMSLGLILVLLQMKNLLGMYVCMYVCMYVYNVYILYIMYIIYMYMNTILYICILCILYYMYMNTILYICI